MRTATSNRFLTVFAAAVAFGASALVAAPASASDTQDAYYAHHRMCVELFFTDREAHAENCLPSRITPSLGSTSKKGSSQPQKEPCYDVRSLESNYPCGCFIKEIPS